MPFLYFNFLSHNENRLLMPDVNKLVIVYFYTTLLIW